MRAVLAILFAILCAGLFVALTARPAHAEPPGLTIATPLGAHPWSSVQTADTIGPPASEHSYRWQLAVADLSALGALIATNAMTDDLDSANGVFVTTYLLGAPMVHASNHHGWRAVGSLAVRAALPVLGLAIGVRLQGDDRCTNCIDSAPPIAGMLLGLGIGGLAALVVDYGVIAKPAKPRRGWSPSAAGAKGGATVGVSATF